MYRKNNDVLHETKIDDIVNIEGFKLHVDLRTSLGTRWFFNKVHYLKAYEPECVWQMQIYGCWRFVN